ncbi:MAG TPA: DUF2461 domain-containing protein [Longimicrobiales bacterium]|nr:DUF2461 domain-containing protein [Longimicrobiales bacterium]
MAYFTRETFAFLKDLAEHNERDWFDVNRHRYEAHVKEPAQRFILAVGEKLDRISPHLRADPRPVGGSLFRIHRDVRFSSDKRPYKTHTGIQFRHHRGKDAHAPGLYLHIEPRSCFLGMGAWRPAGPALKKIRAALVEDPTGWRAAIGGPFADVFELGGESLSRGPRGFDMDHPLAEDLKRKDFIAFRNLPQSFVTGNDVVEETLGLAERGVPFMAFLCRALEVPF